VSDLCNLTVIQNLPLFDRPVLQVTLTPEVAKFGLHIAKSQIPDGCYIRLNVSTGEDLRADGIVNGPRFIILIGFCRGYWSKNLAHLSRPFFPSAKAIPKLQTRMVKAAKMRKACMIKSRRMVSWWNSRSVHRMFPLYFFDFTSNNCKNDQLIQ